MAVTDSARRVTFLPGAIGDPEFWQPAGALLPNSWSKRYVAWPGLGGQPADPEIRGFDDLTEMVAAALPAPSDVVAQSLGCVVAIRLALTYPEKVRRLVLVATSGGVDVSGLGGADWRPGYRRSFPEAPSWVIDDRPDYTQQLDAIRAGTLLIWGDADPLSPPAVGRHIASLLPDATLHVIAGGTHSLGREHAATVGGLIAQHLES